MIFETGSHSVTLASLELTQVGLELTILLLQSTKYWENRHAPPYSTVVSELKEEQISNSTRMEKEKMPT